MAEITRGYRIYRVNPDDSKVLLLTLDATANPTGEIIDSPLSEITNYTAYIVPFDADSPLPSQEGIQVSSSQLTTYLHDITPPFPPSTAVFDAWNGGTSAQIHWTLSSGDNTTKTQQNEEDATGIMGQHIYIGTSETVRPEIFTYDISPSINTYNITDIIKGVANYVWIGAYDYEGNESYSPTSLLLYPDSTAPTVPSTFSYVWENGKPKFTWLASSDPEPSDGTEQPATGISGYNIYRSTVNDFNTSTKLNPSVIDVLEYIDSTIPLYITCYYWVKAVDGGGNLSLPSESQAVSLDQTTPNTPNDGAIILKEKNALTLQWSIMQDNIKTYSYEQDPTGVKQYNVYLSTTTTPPATTSYQPQNPVSGSTVSYRITSLSAGTTYNFWISTVDNGGNESTKSSMITSNTISLDSTPPQPPTNITITDRQRTSITLTWNQSEDLPPGDQVNEEPATGIKGYNIYRNTTNNPATATKIKSINITTSYTNSSLTAGTKYYYWVTAVDNSTTNSGAGNESAKTLLSTPDGSVTTMRNDITPPNPPNNLVLTSRLKNSIGLSWQPSSGDNNIYQTDEYISGLTGYKVYKSTTTTKPTSGAIVVNDLTSQYINCSLPSLTAGTTYNIWVVAYDNSGNESSALTTAVTTLAEDTLPPSVPTNIQPSYIAAKSIDFIWSPSTEDISQSENQEVSGMSKYRIYRNLVPSSSSATKVGEPTTEFFSDSILVPGTRYYYWLSSVDVKGNESAKSTMSSVVCKLLDITAPPAPYNLRTISASTSSCIVAWVASPDSITYEETQEVSGIKGFYVYVNGAKLMDAGYLTEVQINGLSPSSSFNISVTSYDNNNNESEFSNTIIVNTPAADIIFPSAPTNVYATNLASGAGGIIQLNWSTVGDSDLYDYVVYRSLTQNGTYTNIVPSGVAIDKFATNYVVSGLTNGTTYWFKVGARDTSNNTTFSTAVSVVPTKDMNPPYPPSDLTLTKQPPSTIILNWLQPPNLDLAGYNLYRKIGTANYAKINGSIIPKNTLVWNDIQLLQGIIYTYYVTAVDSASNESFQSNEVSGTCNDTYPPSIPQNLHTVSSSFNSLSISWSPSIDDAGVSGYLVYRSQDGINFTQIGSISGVQFTDIGLNYSTSYTYKIKAIDTSGNISDFSESIPLMTSNPPEDITPPDPPNIYSIEAINPFTIELSWNPSLASDTAGYQIYRSSNGGVDFQLIQIVPFNTLSVSDGELTPNTVYYYMIKSFDGHPNFSVQSSVVNKQTLSLDTTPPATPTGLITYAVDWRTITLSWNLNSESDLVGYKIYRNSGTGEVYLKTVSNTSFVDSGLISSQSYSYRISAIDSAGNESNKTNVSSVSTPARTSSPYSGIFFDGTYYWHHNAEIGKLVQLNSNFEIISSTSVPFYKVNSIVFDRAKNMALLVADQKVYAIAPNIVDLQLYELENEIKKGVVKLTNEFGQSRDFLVKELETKKLVYDDARYEITVQGIFMD